MSITDELREWAEDNTLKDRVLPTCPPQHAVHGVLETLLRIADRIDAEHQKACKDAWNNGYEADYLSIEKWLTEHPQVMEHHGFVRLPKDADGVPIHVGDWITGRWDAKAKVVAVTSDDVYWWEPDGCHWCHAFEVRHYHVPTVDDLLFSYGQAYIRASNEAGTEAAKQTMLANLRHEYAAKLRLAGDAE